MEDRSARGRLWTVAVIGCTVLGLETASVQALSYVADYLRAMEVLSVALLGLSLGGVLAYARPTLPEGPLLAAFPLTVVGSLGVIGLLPDQPTTTMVLLSIPYVLASALVSRAFADLPAGRVYQYDLLGAGAGAAGVVVAVPWLREEGTFLLLGCLAAAPLLWRVGWTRVVGGLQVAALVALLVAHVVADPFNLALWTRASGDGKVFPFLQGPEAKRELLVSRGSLVERIDITVRAGDADRGPWTSTYNGRAVDSITRDRAKLGRLDNRMPTHLKLGQDPDTLLVGPSGQGLCKAVQALGNGHVDAVEINAAIAGLMTGPFARRSGNAYGGMDLTVGDVRTFLARTDRRYDYLTLLNTHRIWSMGHLGPPEYVHTREAMGQYFDHLKDDGWVLFEERTINEQAELGVRRLIHTAYDALRARGVEDPAAHTVVWEVWHNCRSSVFSRSPERCPAMSRFTFVMIKRTPVSPAEVAHLREWERMLADRGPDDRGFARGLVWRWLPGEVEGSTWADVVRAPTAWATPQVDAKRHRMDVVTDDRPYPFDVFRERPVLDAMLTRAGGLSALMVLFPALLAFVTGGGARLGGARRAAATAVAVALFGGLGLAYLLVEVVLIQKLGILLSSPVWSLALVLTTLLLASGAGGAASGRLGARGVLGAMVAVVGLALATLGLERAVTPLFALPLAGRLVAAALFVAPLGFGMGMPFPYAMQRVKETLGNHHAALLFAVNGAVGAIAAPVGLWASMEYGFAVTSAAGVGLYGGCALLVGALVALTREPT